jgi:capsular exopolysaccharide synthesis family protein
VNELTANAAEQLDHRVMEHLAAMDSPDASENAQGTRGAFDFRYIAATIRSNLWLILAIIIGTIAIAVVATVLQTPRYTATTTIQINSSTDQILGDKQDNPVSSEMSGYDTERFFQTQIDILKSRAVALRVAQALRVVGNQKFFASQEVRPFPAGTSAEAQTNLAVAILRGNLSVKIPRDSRVVALSFESTDPQVSAQVADTFAKEFIQANLQRKYDSSSYARSFIADQLAETKVRLENSERALNEYARGASLIRMGDSGKSQSEGGSTGAASVTSASLSQLNGAANEAQAARIAAEAHWRSVAGTPLLASKDVLGNAAVQQLIAQKSEIEGELQQERARHLEDYPTVAAKRSQLTAITSQIQAAATNVRNSIRADYDTAVRTEAQLGEQVNRLKTATLEEQDRNVQYGLLAREADTNRQVYEGLLQRFKELNASAGISASNISIVDLAEVPGGPTSPNLFKNLALALALGFGLAAITVFFKDQFDDSIRVPEDVEPKLGMPLLGVIPKSRGGSPEDELVDPKSPVSEAYNSLRGALLYSASGGLPHVMLVTSAQPSEGKTTTSFALSAALGRMGRRVVLVDADMRRPSFHRRVGVSNDLGLSTLLTTGASVDEVLIETEYENLSLIVSGPIPPSPTELISSLRMAAVLEELAGRFDVVMVDSPPVLGLADAPTISALVDGVIFVVEADRSRRGSLKMALRRLRAMRPAILGTVLTKFDPLKSGNRYSEYYGYEYYQYASSEEKSA